jgi:murein DD-endopeptidase MepM/ murein hydrolase activator NlpD
MKTDRAIGRAAARIWSEALMAKTLTANIAIFRDRDFFVHDGAKLRRIRVSAPFQAALFFLLLAMVGWAGYATTQLLSGSREVSAATELRVRQIEQRQAIVAAMLAGQDVDEQMILANARAAGAPVAFQDAIAHAEAVQSQHLAAAAQALDGRYQVASAELRRLGLDPAKVGSTEGTGGPFEAVTKGDPTFKQLFMSWKKLDNLQDGAIAVPSDKPVKTAAFTSGFGVRSDPFQFRAAMHAGIDLAGPLGTPVYATADGVVESAGWNSGGYGNLIKIDHGKGIETRYGHLSKVEIKAGDHVKRGQEIARMGSTGRSTGSHLHYEVRIAGKPVNPIPFMKSTDYLLAMQKNADTHSMDNHIALGGPSVGKR